MAGDPATAPMSTGTALRSGPPVHPLPGTERWAKGARATLLMSSDALALLLAGLVAIQLWAIPVRSQSLATYAPAAPAVLLFVLAYAQAGLYPGFGLGPVEMLRRYFLVTATAFLALAALVFALKIENVYSRITLVIALVLSLVLVPSFRWLVLRFARRFSWWPEPVVLIGSGRRTRLARSLLSRRSGEFQAVGSVDAAGGEAWPSPDPLELSAAYARAGVRTAFADLEGPDAEDVLDRVTFVFPRVIVLRDFTGLPVERVQVRNFGGVLGLEYGNNLLQRQSRWVKRVVDLALGSFLFIVAAPLMLAAMAAVRLLSPGPALFWHVREGQHGRPVRVPKIRTMIPDADRQMEEIFESDPALRDEWQSAFKLRSDPRIIPGVGRFLRRFSLDELPQLWCVLRGEMSLVGPRPFPAYHLDALSTQARRLRQQVRPGISGLWQVTARGTAGVEEQQAHDIYYIRNWSLWLDLYILARTVGVVVSGRGAY